LTGNISHPFIQKYSLKYTVYDTDEQQQQKPSKNVNDLEAEPNRVLQEKADAVQWENYRRVTMDLYHSIINEETL
jgi:hypothetical protein